MNAADDFSTMVNDEPVSVRAAVCRRLAGALVLLAGTALLAGCDQLFKPAARTGGAPPEVTLEKKIKLAPVTPADMKNEIELPASIEGDQMTELASRIEGYVGQVLVDIGDTVTKDQVLIILDVPEIDAEVVRRNKLLEKSNADLAMCQAEMKQAQAAQSEKQALIDQRIAEHKRLEGLVDRGSIRREKLEEAEFAVQSAKASLQRVLADISAAQARMKSAEAAIAVADAELKKAQAMAEYLKIKAPFDGIVTRRTIDPGAFVQPMSNGGMSLLTIESVDRVRIVFFVPIKDAPLLDQEDQVVLHSVAGLKGRRFPESGQAGTLRVTRYAKSLDRQSRMMRAEVELANPVDPSTEKRTLKPGDYGTVTVSLESFSAIPTVPASAVSETANESYVMAVDSGMTCHRVAVEVMVSSDQVVGFRPKGLTTVPVNRVIARDLADFKHGQLLDANNVE